MGDYRELYRERVIKEEGEEFLPLTQACTCTGTQREWKRGSDGKGK